MTKIAIGAAAPDVTLPDQDGKTQKLRDRRGQWVLVYFYPRDDTPGCTVEACGVRDEWKAFRAGGVEVLGISADSAASHRKFADKFKLPFTLLADQQKSAIRAFGTWGKKKFMGREFDGILRQSFLIDPAGKIAKIYRKVKPAEHAAEVLADVRALSSGAAPAAAARSGPARKRTPRAAKAARPRKRSAKSSAKSPAKRAKAGRGRRSKGARR
jgi:peroxiredoxin Q/BCP